MGDVGIRLICLIKFFFPSYYVSLLKHNSIFFQIEHIYIGF